MNEIAPRYPRNSARRSACRSAPGLSVVFPGDPGIGYSLTIITIFLASDPLLGEGAAYDVGAVGESRRGRPIVWSARSVGRVQDGRGAAGRYLRLIARGCGELGKRLGHIGRNATGEAPTRKTPHLKLRVGGRERRARLEVDDILPLPVLAQGHGVFRQAIGLGWLAMLIGFAGLALAGLEQLFGARQ